MSSRWLLQGTTEIRILNSLEINKIIDTKQGTADGGDDIIEAEVEIKSPLLPTTPVSHTTI